MDMDKTNLNTETARPASAAGAAATIIPPRPHEPGLPRPLDFDWQKRVAELAKAIQAPPEEIERERQREEQDRKLKGLELIKRSGVPDLYRDVDLSNLGQIPDDTRGHSPPRSSAASA